MLRFLHRNYIFHNVSASMKNSWEKSREKVAGGSLAQNILFTKMST